MTRHGFTVTRHFSAPVEKVFAAFTQPDKLDWFFNPGHRPDLPTTVDLRVGGYWRQEMIVNADHRYITGGQYLEIEAPHLLVLAWGAVDGWPLIDPDNPGAGPSIRITLSPRGSGTQMDFAVELPENMAEAEARKWLDSGMHDGWSMTLDRLVAAMAG